MIDIISNSGSEGHDSLLAGGFYAAAANPNSNNNLMPMQPSSFIGGSVGPQNSQFLYTNSPHQHSHRVPPSQQHHHQLLHHHNQNQHHNPATIHHQNPHHGQHHQMPLMYSQLSDMSPPPSSAAAATMSMAAQKSYYDFNQTQQASNSSQFCFNASLISSTNAFLDMNGL